jgi:aminopeptidase N
VGRGTQECVRHELSTSLLGLWYGVEVIAAWAALFAAASVTTSPPGRGIAETLANERADTIQSVRYDLKFQIPEPKNEPIHATAVVRFTLRAAHRVVLDFEQPRDHVLAVEANGRPSPFDFADGHLIVPITASKPGENAIRVEFIAGDDALNRNADFLYTLFVPARAHLAFPCFDQPNLKGRYQLTLEIPAGWQAVANGAELDPRTLSADLTAASGPGRKVLRFAETRPLPTYLFAFAAGKFQIETGVRDGRTFRMFHRETDSAKVARNREAIFDLHARALSWLEDYTGIPYPWGKFDFVLIPSFQFGGMEHAGAIFYNAASLMLDESATQNQFLGRASVISHETSHMWFGDLVTMRWFNDVWMKEVMANFMAAKIVNPSFPQVDHALRFLLEHYPAAYDVDRTAGSNPIRQELANLNEAGTLYGPIIYNKAPIAMRQLELITGEEGFRDGLREYLHEYSFGNATWLDLVRILDERGRGTSISAWSKAWIEMRGRPEIRTTLRSNANGISSLTLTERDPLGRGLVWPQRLQVLLGYPDHVEKLDVSIDARETSVAKARGMQVPLYVLPNGGGLAYGLFLLDDTTREYFLAHLENIRDPLTRGSAWVDLWENLLEGRVAPAEFLDLAARALPLEVDEQNVQRVLSYVSRAFWQFLPQEDRLARAPALETLLRQGVAKAFYASEKSAWFTAYREVALTPDGLAWLKRVWRREERVTGLAFAETDEINMALELAVRGLPDSREILAEEHDRIQNPDRKARFEFVTPALAEDLGVRRQAFERLRTVDNRRHEPWALESLRYLNHPLRQESARQFIRPSLDLLPEIQRTGDIFFPARWAEAVLASQRSPEAAAIVREYLAKTPKLPERLRWDVLASADDLFRASGTPARRSVPRGRQSSAF